MIGSILIPLKLSRLPFNTISHLVSHQNVMLWPNGAGATQVKGVTQYAVKKKELVKHFLPEYNCCESECQDPRPHVNAYALAKTRRAMRVLLLLLEDIKLLRAKMNKSIAKNYPPQNHYPVCNRYASADHES